MEKQIEVEKLNLKQEGNWIKRKIWTAHGKKTIVYVLLGAAAGLILYLASTESKIENVSFVEIAQNMLFGALFGLFITNSPCARNKC